MGVGTRRVRCGGYRVAAALASWPIMVSLDAARSCGSNSSTASLSVQKNVVDLFHHNNGMVEDILRPKPG